MGKNISNLIQEWKRRNIEGIYCKNKQEASDKILELISKESSVGLSGSQTLDALGVVKRLEDSGIKVFNQYQPGISLGASQELRRQGISADFYLASANAISESGELVFFSAYGNRTAGISYAKTTLIVCGVNKITPDLASALKRAREIATPLNCKRLSWNTPCVKDGICRQEICYFPEYKRMCCQILIIEGEVIPDRFKVILVGENLGL